FFFSSRRRHTRLQGDWSSDVCSSDLCGVCHTLAAANAVGKVGPNLDMLKPAYTLVAHTITYGCLQDPPSTSAPTNCLGQGNMPAAILQGTQARDVAQFVAKVAGKE